MPTRKYREKAREGVRRKNVHGSCVSVCSACFAWRMSDDGNSHLSHCVLLPRLLLHLFSNSVLIMSFPSIYLLFCSFWHLVVLFCAVFLGLSVPPESNRPACAATCADYRCLMFLLQVGDADADEYDDWREVDEDCTRRLEGFFLILSVYLLKVCFF